MVILHESFNLNSQRIVNFRVNQGNQIYLYDLKGKTLYYSSKSLSQIQGDLGIHPHTCKSCINPSTQVQDPVSGPRGGVIII